MLEGLAGLAGLGGLAGLEGPPEHGRVEQLGLPKPRESEVEEAGRSRSLTGGVVVRAHRYARVSS